MGPVNDEKSYKLTKRTIKTKNMKNPEKSQNL